MTSPKLATLTMPMPETCAVCEISVGYVGHDDTRHSAKLHRAVRVDSIDAECPLVEVEND
jgi:hypothetical protein